MRGARTPASCVRRWITRASPSVSLARVWNINRKKYLHSIPCVVVDRRSRTRRARPSCTHREIRTHRKHRKTRGKTQSIAVIVYARHPSVAPVVPVSSPRHHRSSSSSSSVVLPHPPPRCVLVASSVVAPTSSSSSRRTHTTGDVQTVWWSCLFHMSEPSVFHVSELCIFIDACARRSGSGFSYTVSSMFVFHHSNSIRDTSDASTRVGVHVSDMWKRRGWASTVD